MKTFRVYRQELPENHPEGAPPDQPQFEGIVFEDGRVAIRWLTPTASTAIYDSLAAVVELHGHPEYGTRFEFFTCEPDQELTAAFNDVTITTR